MKKSAGLIVNAMLKGDKLALARLITYVDNRHENLTDMMKAVYARTGRACLVGVTGPPGAGKSTLIDKLITIYRSKKMKVGIVAIDPSSPFSGGAVLGDRIRMTGHAADDGVFIRSLGSRGSHGGLSRATRDTAHLMDAFGMDIIMIETVGVGQTELDIMSVAHTTVVVLVPESGDTIQTMKAGLMEIADIFVVNKADRPGADQICAELASVSDIHAVRQIPVFKTEATTGRGVSELAEATWKSAMEVRKGATFKDRVANLLKEECLDIFLAEVHNKVGKEFRKDGALEKNYSSLVSKHQNPYRTATEILKKFGWK